MLETGRALTRYLVPLAKAVGYDLHNLFSDSGAHYFLPQAVHSAEYRVNSARGNSGMGRYFVPRHCQITISAGNL